MTTETAEPQTIQEAFESAKAEHSAPAQNEPAATEASTGVKAPATTTDEAKAAPPVSVAATPDISDLISDEELTALKAKHTNDPDAIAKELKAAFTRKTQALAEQRKGVESLAAYKDFIADLEKDPQGALTRAAEQLGVTLTPKSTTAKATETAAATAETMANEAMASFKAALGPDLDFLADKLAPAIQALAQNVAQAAVGQAVAPLQTAQQTLLDKAATEQKDAVLATFTEKHPDWKTHEAAITKLATTMPPGKHADPVEYLDRLYKLVTYDARVASDVKLAVARMTTGANAEEGKSFPLSGSQVALAPPDINDPDFLRKCFEEAKREVMGS